MPRPFQIQSSRHYQSEAGRPRTRVTVTFPDGAKREFPKDTTGLDIAKGISPSLAKRTVAMALNGATRRPQRPDRRRTPQIEFVSRDDPRALELIRHDCAHVLAEAVQSAVARHAGDDRPGDRERLLLRLLPQRAVHAGRFRRDREEDARDHRARSAVHQAGLGPREDQAGVPRQGRGLQGRTGGRHSRPTSRSRSTSRATGSISAAVRT